MQAVSSTELVLIIKDFFDLKEQLGNLHAFRSELELLVGPKRVLLAFSVLRFNSLMLFPHITSGTLFYAATRDMNKVIRQLS
jgi:hypothetical protein